MEISKSTYQPFNKTYIYSFALAIGLGGLTQGMINKCTVGYFFAVLNTAYKPLDSINKWNDDCIIFIFLYFFLSSKRVSGCIPNSYWHYTRMHFKLLCSNGLFNKYLSLLWGDDN